MLKASDNRLLSVLDFPAAEGGSRLRVAELCRNQIVGAVSLPPDPITDEDLGVDAHAGLEELRLDGNSVRSLRGIEVVSHLRLLSVGGNELQDTAGLAPLTALRTLDLSSNGLVACDELPWLVNLTSLSLANNQLSTLPAALGAAATRLGSLDLSDCQLPSLSAVVKTLGGAGSPLRSLWLRGNPMETAYEASAHIGHGVHKDLEGPAALADFRLYALYSFPRLHELDGVPASAEDKVAAANHHGADTADLIAIRRSHFPEVVSDATSACAAELPSLIELYKNQYTAAFGSKASSNGNA
jgi:Leucine-rich repeat (LRR) protein